MKLLEWGLKLGDFAAGREIAEEQMLSFKADYAASRQYALEAFASLEAGLDRWEEKLAALEKHQTALFDNISSRLTNDPDLANCEDENGIPLRTKLGIELQTIRIQNWYGQ